jgi:D-arabinose 1-dehydrogenase-like Zn-dependent alcohol dehydrogenase
MTVEYMQFVEAHGIKPVIARTFDFKDAIEAMETMANGTEVGKIVIKIGEAE